MKIIGTIWRRSALSKAGYRSYYRDVHGPIVARDAGETRLYVQNWVEDAVVYCGDDRPPVTPPDGVTELWYDDLAGVSATFGAPYALEVSGPDVRNYADMSRGVGLLGEEQTIFGTPDSDAGLVKTMLFILLEDSGEASAAGLGEVLATQLRAVSGLRIARLAIEADRSNELVRAFGSAPGRPRCVAVMSMFHDSDGQWEAAELAQSSAQAAGTALGARAFALLVRVSPHVVLDRRSAR